jgi:hypothetical protein
LPANRDADLRRLTGLVRIAAGSTVESVLYVDDVIDQVPQGDAVV